MCLHRWKRLVYGYWLHCVVNTGSEPGILVNRIGNLDGQWTISTNKLTKLRRALSKNGRWKFPRSPHTCFYPRVRTWSPKFPENRNPFRERVKWIPTWMGRLKVYFRWSFDFLKRPLFRNRAYRHKSRISEKRSGATVENKVLEELLFPRGL